MMSKISLGMKSEKLHPWMLFLSLAMCATAHADDTSLGLLDAYQRGLTQDPRLAAAAAQFRNEKEAYDSALAGLMPNMGASGAYGYTEQETTYSYKTSAPSGQHSYKTTNYGVTLNQAIYRKDRIEGFSQSKIAEAQAAARLEASNQDYILRVAQAYVDVLLAADNLELSRVEKTANEGQRQRAKRAFEVGTATINDVSDAQARYDLTVAREIAAANNLEIARGNLARVIGPGNYNLSPLAADIPLLPPNPADVEQWIQKALAGNLQFRIASQGQEIASYEVERTKGIAYPSLDLVATYGKTNQTSSTFSSPMDSMQSGVQLQLSVPLYSGGLASSRLRAVRADKERVTQMLEDSRRQVITQAQQAYLNAANGMEQVRALQQAVASSQSALDATQRGMEVGLRTALDVLNAQQQLFTAKRDFANARYQYLLAQLKLKSVVGELGEEDLRRLDKWFVKRSG